MRAARTCFVLFFADGLKEYFSKFGEVVGVDIKMDALTGRSRFVNHNSFKLVLPCDEETSNEIEAYDCRCFHYKYNVFFCVPPTCERSVSYIFDAVNLCSRPS